MRKFELTGDLLQVNDGLELVDEWFKLELDLYIEIILIEYYNHHMEAEPVKARVTQLLGRTGSRGGITQVKVILISGKEADKRHLIRNVKGPVRIGDVLELMESEREARRLRWFVDHF